MLIPRRGWRILGLEEFGSSFEVRGYLGHSCKIFIVSSGLILGSVLRNQFWQYLGDHKECWVGSVQGKCLPPVLPLVSSLAISKCQDSKASFFAS